MKMHGIHLAEFTWMSVWYNTVMPVLLREKRAASLRGRVKVIFSLCCMNQDINTASVRRCFLCLSKCWVSVLRSRPCLVCFMSNDCVSQQLFRLWAESRLRLHKWSLGLLILTPNLHLFKQETRHRKLGERPPTHPVLYLSQRPPVAPCLRCASGPLPVLSGGHLSLSPRPWSLPSTSSAHTHAAGGW